MIIQKAHHFDAFPMDISLTFLCDTRSKYTERAMTPKNTMITSTGKPKCSIPSQKNIIFYIFLHTMMQDRRKQKYEP
jgi:hypothetical protein